VPSKDGEGAKPEDNRVGRDSRETLRTEAGTWRKTATGVDAIRAPEAGRLEAYLVLQGHRWITCRVKRRTAALPGAVRAAKLP